MNYGVMRITSCCGLDEFHNLSPYTNNYNGAALPINKGTFRKGKAYFATTTNDMKDQVKDLKKAGFRKVGKWRNGNTGRTITMWVKNIRRI